MDGERSETHERESEVYDAITGVFLGVPAVIAVPVLCEALIHAINCAENSQREEMRDVSIATIQEHVDLLKSYVTGAAH